MIRFSSIIALYNVQSTMIRISSVLALVLLSVLSFGKNGLTEVKGFGANPGNLKMLLYLPGSVDENRKLPVVVVLHGCSENANVIAKQSGWNDLADQHQFIVLYPQQKMINNPSNCFNWFKPMDTDTVGGELNSIINMITYAKLTYKIDTASIFVYGLSAGALMSVNLLVKYPNLFSKGAILAGGPYGCATNVIQASKVLLNPSNKSAEEWGNLILNLDSNVTFPPIVIVHGTKDKVVDIQNSYELTEQWTYIHHTDTIVDVVTYSFMDNPLVDRKTYYDSLNNEVVIFYQIAKMGHSLPIDPGKKVNQGGETGIFSVDKNFHSTYYIAKDFGLIK